MESFAGPIVMGIDLKSLFVAHEREIGTFLRRRVGSSTDVPDLAQETFLRFARLRSNQAIEDPRRFLFTIAANLARDHLRRFVRHQRVETGPVEEAVVCSNPTPEEALGAAQERHLLRDAIEALPARTRTIFLLYHVEECSYREIGERLGISPRTVEYHLRQALEHCRNHVRRSGDRSRRG